MKATIVWSCHVIMFGLTGHCCLLPKSCSVSRDVATTSTYDSAKPEGPGYTSNTTHKNEEQISQICNQSISKSCSQNLVNPFVRCVVGKKQEYLVGEGKGKSSPVTGLEWPRGFQISSQRHRMVVRLSALRTCRLYPQEIHLVLISLRG